MREEEENKEQHNGKRTQGQPSHDTGGRGEVATLRDPIAPELPRPTQNRNTMHVSFDEPKPVSPVYEHLESVVTLWAFAITRPLARTVALARDDHRSNHTPGAPLVLGLTAPQASEER